MLVLQWQAGLEKLFRSYNRKCEVVYNSSDKVMMHWQDLAEIGVKSFDWYLMNIGFFLRQFVASPWSWSYRERALWAIVIPCLAIVMCTGVLWWATIVAYSNNRGGGGTDVLFINELYWFHLSKRKETWMTHLDTAIPIGPFLSGII